MRHRDAEVAPRRGRPPPYARAFGVVPHLIGRSVDPPILRTVHPGDMAGHRVLAWNLLGRWRRDEQGRCSVKESTNFRMARLRTKLRGVGESGDRALSLQS